MLSAQDVHLLLFSDLGIFFGVYAEQVKELLKTDSLFEGEYVGPGRSIPYKGEELQIIRFSRRLKLHEALEENHKFLYRQDLKTKEETEALSQTGADGLEPPSRILVVRHYEEGDIGVHVDCLEQLRAVRLGRIFRLPFMMEKKKLFQAVWGLALIDERPVVLVDLEHI